MSDAQHTPTPWRIELKDYGLFFINNASKRSVCTIGYRKDIDDEDMANAEHIVRCVNSHDALVAACEAAQAALSELIGADYDLSGEQEQLRAALRKARDDQ